MLIQEHAINCDDPLIPAGIYQWFNDKDEAERAAMPGTKVLQTSSRVYRVMVRPINRQKTIKVWNSSRTMVVAMVSTQCTSVGAATAAKAAAASFERVSGVYGWVARK